MRPQEASHESVTEVRNRTTLAVVRTDVFVRKRTNVSKPALLS